MRVFRSRYDRGWEREIASLALGAVSGLAIGALFSRLLPATVSRSSPRTPSGRPTMGRIRPAPLRRLLADQEDLDHLESAVLSRLLEDPILSERGIDVGAISHGIIELSGSVWTDAEAARAVSVANEAPGVETVVNRMEIEDLVPRRAFSRGGRDEFDESFDHQASGRVGGMGQRRQGRETDPLRPDDSQPMRERALAAADREQAEDEDFTDSDSQARARGEVLNNPTNFSEDELDNQDPHGKHTRATLDRPPEELNSFARVGEGTKPRTELRLERADTEIQPETQRDREG